ncbi:hypothetical protein SEA_ABBYDAISY_71 [Arthrobacter phage AbbyDaisy]|nr:hypothetical protein SEA_ABBYDAISY_71 [Arthrobacter phage AbbyDaisy]
MNEDEAAVTIVAAPLERGDRSGSFGAILRMGTGRVHLHITPETAQQWLPIINEIAQEGD